MTTNISSFFLLTLLLFIQQRPSTGFIVTDTEHDCYINFKPPEPSNLVPITDKVAKGTDNQPPASKFVPINHDYEFAEIVKATKGPIGGTDTSSVDAMPNEVAVKTAKGGDMSNSTLVMQNEKRAYQFLENKLPFIPKFYMFGTSNQRLTVDDQVVRNPVAIITDYVGTISLDNYVLWRKQRNENLTQPEIRILAAELFRMLVILYNNDVIHGNVRPQNILLNLKIKSDTYDRINQITEIYLVDLSNAAYRDKPRDSPLTENFIWSSITHNEKYRQLEPTMLGDTESFLYIILWLGQDNIKPTCDKPKTDDTQSVANSRISFGLLNSYMLEETLEKTVIQEKKAVLTHLDKMNFPNLSDGLYHVLTQIRDTIKHSPAVFTQSEQLQRLVHTLDLFLPVTTVVEEGNDVQRTRKLSDRICPATCKIQ